MKILGINHIGIAAKDPKKASHFFTEILGLPSLGDELVEDQNTMTRMFPSNSTQDPRLELLEVGDASAPSPIASFIEKRGGGLHHIALNVANITEAISYMKEKGVRMIDTEPRDGAHQTKIAFVHPKEAGGILIELVQQT